MNSTTILEDTAAERSEEHTSELQSPCNLVCRLLLEKKNRALTTPTAEPCSNSSTNLVASTLDKPSSYAGRRTTSPTSLTFHCCHAHRTDSPSSPRA